MPDLPRGDAATRRSLLEWKRALIADVGLSDERQEFELGLPGEPFHVPPDVLGYLRLAAIAEQTEREAVDRCESPWQLLCGELCFFDAVPVSERVDRDAARRLEAACKRSLLGYARGGNGDGLGGENGKALRERADVAIGSVGSVRDAGMGFNISPIEDRSEAAQRSVERAVDAARLVMSEQTVLRATVEMLETFSFRWLARCSML
jgi:hypothetical protein